VTGSLLIMSSSFSLSSSSRVSESSFILSTTSERVLTVRSSVVALSIVSVMSPI